MFIGFSISLLLSSCKTTDTHVHSFTIQNTDEKYIKEFGDCEKKAVYYYSCSCGEKGNETFEYGKISKHSIDANYICDMICPTCGSTIKKLEPTNEYLALLDAQDYKDDAYKFYSSLSKIYSYIDASKQDETGEHMMNIISNIVEAMGTLNEAFDNLYANYAQYMYYYVRGTQEDINAYNELIEIQKDISKQSSLYVAHLFFSPLKSVFFDESDYEYMEVELKKIIDAQLNEEDDTEESQVLSEKEQRLKELSTTISAKDTTVDTQISLLGEYIDLANELNSGNYSNLYEHSFATYYKSTRTIKEEDEYRNNLINYLISNNPEVHNFGSTISYSANERYLLQTSVFSDDDILRNAISYFQTLKNDEVNLFDKVNEAFKEGKVFQFVIHSISCNANGAIIFDSGSQSGSTAFAHEFGHYFLTYGEGSLAVTEFAAIADEALYSAYVANKMDKNSEEYKSIVIHVINDFLASALEAAYTDEFARSIYFRSSDIDGKYSDGISNEELSDFAKDLNLKYGYSTDNEYIIRKAINYSLSSPAYNISYSNNYLLALSIFCNALDNYQDSVNSYISFLYNPIKDNTTNDYYLPTLKANNFLSPFDESTFVYLKETIQNLKNN